MRRSSATKRNRQLGDWSDWAKDKDNLDFFAEAIKVMEKEYEVGNRGAMAIGLVGSRDIPGITLRRAQSVLRWDRRPSLWSHAILIGKPWNGRKSTIKNVPILEVPLFPRNGKFPDPAANGWNSDATLATYNDASVDVNVALIAVARRVVAEDKSVTIQALDRQDVRRVRQRANDPNSDRLRYDIWESLCAWQQYLWSDGEGTNPLREGVPIPSSAYVEMAYEGMELDLVPGASERNSAPEHIWNAAQWWYQEELLAEEGDDIPFLLTGCYALRDIGGSMID